MKNFSWMQLVRELNFLNDWNYKTWQLFLQLRKSTPRKLENCKFLLSKESLNYSPLSFKPIAETSVPSVLWRSEVSTFCFFCIELAFIISNLCARSRFIQIQTCTILFGTLTLRTRTVFKKVHLDGDYFCSKLVHLDDKTKLF